MECIRSGTLSLAFQGASQLAPFSKVVHFNKGCHLGCSNGALTLLSFARRRYLVPTGHEVPTPYSIEGIRGIVALNVSDVGIMVTVMQFNILEYIWCEISYVLHNLFYLTRQIS